MKVVQSLCQAQGVIGYSFREPSNLETALTHASVADKRLDSNERLEFLGDAILGMVVCEELYRRFDQWQEGDLTKVKSAVVSRRACALVSDEAGLTRLLVLGNGIESSNDLPTSVRAAVYESIIGAIYVDGGLDPAREFILRTLSGQIDRFADSSTHGNYKSVLQQHAQRWMSATPRYEALDEQGPDHSKCFEVGVVIAGRHFPSAWGASKKEAEQEAARLALDVLQSKDDDKSSGD